MAQRFTIPVMMAQDIAPESWLNEERFRWFRRGYSYAGTQTRAIEALSACSPEALYFAVTAIMRGNGWDEDELVSRDPYVYDRRTLAPPAEDAD